MDYDLAVIGAGWAGFNAAIEAKQLGLKVCLVENNKIGGTCLNRGCIPTKSLIQSAKVYSLIKQAKNFGIDNLEPKINFPAIQQRKDKIIQQLRQGMEFMLKGIDVISGQARLASADTLKVSEKEIKARDIIIACGSRPIEIPGFKFDTKKIISSDEILELKEIPGSLLIVGGGVIGCEFASLFNILGAQVTVAEKMPQLLPNEDREIAKRLEAIFKKKRIKVNTGIDAASLDLASFDLILVCVGRKPNTDGLGLEDLKIAREKGKITVDEFLRTNIPNIYAAGDCTGKIMLAHYAAYQGEIAAWNIAKPNQARKSDNAVVPNCIFTAPEISSVGLGEEAALAKGIETVIKKFDFLASGMARIIDEAEGFIKVVLEKKTGIVLGASIIGPKATELISVFGVAISSRLNVEQLKNTIFAHPTISESVHEAVK